jgi:pimeloyl-ACP methyl ester carboxylesterase
MRTARVHAVVGAVVICTIVGGCGGGTATTTSNVVGWQERNVSFGFDGEMLHGVLTVPSGSGPHPAIVLIAGSADSEGVRSNSTSRWFIDHARGLASEGFTVLRYDPPGVGRSTGETGLPSLEGRVEETAAALGAVRSEADVDADRVGLLGVSQGSWVIAMTAAQYPDEVAFLISVLGSGQSVAEQQIYGIRAQSMEAGLPPEDVTKAVVFGRLLVDWQLRQPVFREVNERDINAMPVGPWNDFMAITYQEGVVDPVARLNDGLAILESVQDESWTEALHLRDLYLPRFGAIPDDITPELLEAVQLQTELSLLTDPKDFLTEVDVPVLAFFGENDPNVDSAIGAARFEEYLSEAGNPDFTIHVLEGVAHDITTATVEYWDRLVDWLADRYRA